MQQYQSKLLKFNPKDSLSVLIHILLLLTICAALKGQTIHKKDSVIPVCLISGITLKGGGSTHGLHVFLPEVLFDLSSETDATEIHMYLENKDFFSGDFLMCGIHNITLTNSKYNVSKCNFTITIKCDNKDRCQLNKPNKEVNSLPERIGTMSAYWESNGGGPGVISNKNGDPGGKSYGTYQISSNHGYLENFLNNEAISYKPLFEGHEMISTAFDSIWRMIALEETEVFELKQHEFIDRTHYRVFIRRLKQQLDMDVNNYSPIIKEVIWSTAVQHGPFNNIVNFALAGLDLEFISERTIIELIYQERGLIENERLFYYPRTNANWQKFLIQRFNKEKDYAISKL